MKVKMSSFLREKKEFIKRMIETLSKEYAYVSILGTDSYGKQYSVQRSSTSLNDSMWVERGFVARVFNGRAYAEFSFNDVNEGSFDAILNQIRGAAGFKLCNNGNSNLTVSSYPLIEEEAVTDSFIADAGKGMDSLSAKEKLAKLTKIKDDALALSDLLVDVRASYEEVHISKIFISSKKDLEQSYVWAQGAIVPIVRKDDKTKYSYKSFSGLKSVELFDEMENAAKEIVDIAIGLLDAGTITPGEYEVICTPDVAGLIAHEAFGHGVEMDMFVKGRAKAPEYINKEVASEKTTMHDGAKSAHHMSSYLFDDEGVMGTDTVIIENGILKRGISDLLSALKLGTVPTGNGKRQSFERKAYSRMTNTFFAYGKETLEDMVSSIEHGYIIEQGMSGMEDPKNWGIQCMLMQGREIKNGKLTGKIVAPVIMTGYVPDLLKSISMVSGEVELSGSGYCGKGYKEFVKVSAGGPYIKAKARLG